MGPLGRCRLDSWYHRVWLGHQQSHRYCRLNWNRYRDNPREYLECECGRIWRL